MYVVMKYSSTHNDHWTTTQNWCNYVTVTISSLIMMNSHTLEAVLVI